MRRLLEERLRAAIVEGVFPPGAHLSDRALCETFGTSRTVVREAVRLLEAEGLVVQHPNRGPFVAIISRAEAAEIYEVRAALEALAGEGFALRATDDERAALREVYAEICAATAEMPRGALLALKRRFYDVLTTGSRNSYAARMLDMVLSRNGQLRAISLSSQNRLAGTIAEIGRIIEAVERRDPQAAAEACRAHVRAAADVALGILAAQETEALAKTA